MSVFEKQSKFRQDRPRGGLRDSKPYFSRSYRLRQMNQTAVTDAGGLRDGRPDAVFLIVNLKGIHSLAEGDRFSHLDYVKREVAIQGESNLRGFLFGRPVSVA